MNDARWRRRDVMHDVRWGICDVMDDVRRRRCDVMSSYPVADADSATVLDWVLCDRETETGRHGECS